MKIAIRNKPLKEIRKENLVPGVIYGKSVKSTSIQVEEKELLDTLKTYGKNLTFQISIGRKKHQVYIKHIQSEILKPNHIIHFELHALAKDETVLATIPVHLTGKEILEKERLFVQFNISNIECEYAPGFGVSHFDFDVSNLKVGDQVLIKDLVIPEGVKIHHEANDVIFSIKEAVMIEEETIEEDIETDEVEEESTIET